MLSSDMALGMLPNTNMISHSTYTQSAFCFGDYYGHMALFPVLDTMKNKSEKVQSNSPYTQLSDWLFGYFAGAPAKYEFKIQLGTSPEHHPTEDASIIRGEVTSPYRTIGTLESHDKIAFRRKEGSIGKIIWCLIHGGVLWHIGRWRVSMLEEGGLWKVPKEEG
ncbi:hypothetical protein OEA41_005448 [Lepraria neglecta]|uniref:Uncharacterized protein n=1 Tax=Lepraria neglecta TaxID=209136 RepID=A0AAE0DH16_9LECA|nr:hypothetical protein OEA41_005448 [Lepraria neglecta]